MMRLLIVSLIFWTSFLADQLAAQDWAEKMFSKREHNFGTVARGADTVYRFEITNLYKQPMHITGVRSSCGCTTPTIENSTIKTHEKAYVVAKFNTRTFTGFHGATLTVSFGPPYRAEVQVRVHGNIRGDVVFSPGAVQFGNVDEGVPSNRTLTVTYAGRQNWRIVDVTNDNDHFEVELKELSRGAGKVSYNLLVRLKDNVPAGYVKDQLTVVTNDSRRESQRIPLFVEGRVVPEISITPENLVLGDVAPGSTLTRKVVVRGKNPFRIVDVNCGDDCFTFNTGNDSKTLHLVEVIFRPDAKPGTVRVPVRILTDRGGSRGATLTVSANVLQPTRPSTTQVDPSSQVGESTAEVQVAGAAGN
ncbi:MAG: DUF1573 domain-containing protein [Pirellulales bacterium]|nr:DUF1573 domain-containing protein [Pirellulales bacterium]